MTDKKQIKKMKKSIGKGKGTPPLKGPTPVANPSPKNRFATGGLVKNSKMKNKKC